MSGYTAGRPSIKQLVATLLLLALILASVAANSVHSSSVTVSPGKYDLLLGDDFPTFGSVKLSYPNSAILTNSTGDLLFNVTLGLNSITPRGLVRGVNIYIPPDFSGLSISELWTSFTNNYDPNSVRVSRLSSADQIGPNWWQITVSNLILTKDHTKVNPENRTFLANQTQYIRLFQVTSPTIAGRYFFKAFVNGTSIGARNFPTLVVKASRDPAYISGIIRDFGDRDPSRAGKPITLPHGTGARVLATGRSYLGTPVSAQAFINYTAGGNYTLFGVAPGTYNITAYAAGYIPATRPWTVSVASAQSLEGVDIYMQRSVVISGTVLSETAGGSPVPWGKVCTNPSPNAIILASNATTYPCPRVQEGPRFPNLSTSRSITIDVLNLDGTVAESTPSPYRITTFTDPNATTFDFALQHYVGFDGRIPQDYANYTSGLPSSGDYLLRAFVTSYVQLYEVRVHVVNETTDAETIIPLIRTGIINVTVHFKNSLNSTLVDSPMNACAFTCTLTVSAYDMQGVLKAQNVTFVPSGVTSWSVELQGFSNARGFGIASLFQQNYGLLPGTYYVTARITASAFISGNANLGIATLYYQTSNILATIGLGEGTVDISFFLYKAAGILLALYSINYQIPPLFEPWSFPGKTITITIIPTFPIQTNYQTNSTQPVFNATLPIHYNARLNLTLLGLQTGSYDVVIRTLGYTQREILHVNAVLGWNIDAPIWMIQNPVIDLTIAFRHESILTFIDSTLPFAQPINNLTATPTRIEVFDHQGNFIAANATYIANGNSTAHFLLAGFDRYFGDPRLIWSGFYDTTDAVSQNPGGLILYPWSLSPRTYTIRIWIDGYYQLKPLQMVVTPPQNVSVVAVVDRASRILGTVSGPDYFDIARPLSWATIILQPDNYTLTTIIYVRPGNYTTSSLDGSFQLWVPQGTYGMGVSLAGYAPYSARVAVPKGSDMFMEIWLDNY